MARAAPRPRRVRHPGLPRRADRAPRAGARLVSAGVATAGRLARRAGPPILRCSPAEGWLTLVSAALMVVVFAISLIDAGWTPGPRRAARRFLIWAGLLGFAIGVIGAKIGWGRWRTHLVGALFGGLLLPLVDGRPRAGRRARLGAASSSQQRLAAALHGHGERLERPRRSCGSVHEPDRPLPPGLRRARLWRRPARGVHGVRPSPAARCGRRRRPGDAREHGDHAATTSCTCWSCSARRRSSS